MILLLSLLSKVSKVFNLLIIFRISFWKLCCFLGQDITYFYTVFLYSGTGGRVIHIPEKKIAASGPKKSLKSGYVHLPILT